MVTNLLVTFPKASCETIKFKFVATSRLFVIVNTAFLKSYVKDLVWVCVFCDNFEMNAKLNNEYVVELTSCERFPVEGHFLAVAYVVWGDRESVSHGRKCRSIEPWPPVKNYALFFTCTSLSHFLCGSESLRNALLPPSPILNRKRPFSANPDMCHGPEPQFWIM